MNPPIDQSLTDCVWLHTVCSQGAGRPTVVGSPFKTVEGGTTLVNSIPELNIRASALRSQKQPKQSIYKLVRILNFKTL